MNRKQIVSMMTAAAVFTVMVFSGAAGAAGSIGIYNGTTTELCQDDIGRTVCGNQGGYATLTAVEGDTWTVELTDFTVTADDQILYSDDIPNLRIVLNGTSNMASADSNNHTGVLQVKEGNLTITTRDGKSGSLVVNNTVTGESILACAIGVEHTLTIDSGAEVTAIADISTPQPSAALYTHDGDIRISGEDTAVTVIAAGHSGTYALYSARDILIGDGAEVRAHARTTADSEDMLYLAEALAAWSGDISISGSARVTALAESPGSASVHALKSCRIFVDNGVVDASAVSSKGAASALVAEQNITIGKGSTITAAAAGAEGYAFFVWRDTGDIRISDCTMIAASGSNSSFAIRNAGRFDIAQLADTHTFQNGTQPITCSDLADDWHSCLIDDEPAAASNYTAVTIARTAEQATQSSPAPLAGILAGLGAGALVLARLRK